MKYTIIHIALFIVLFSLNSIKASDKILILQPDSCRGKDASVGDCIPCGFYSANFGSNDDLTVGAWTFNGNPSVSRVLIQFDLSSIPASATISNAKLSLYHNPNPANGNIGHSQLSGSNEAWIQRITSSWTEFGVSWANMPTATTQNQVVLPASLSNTQDYINVDVSLLVQDMVSNPSQSFGFLLQLQTESYYRSLLFASSDHLNPALHPKLEIEYKDTIQCISIQPDNSICSDGKDAEIGDCVPCGFYNANFGMNDDLTIGAWTVSGNASTSRALLEFDLSSIPSNAVISSADLSLFYNPNPANGNIGHSQLSGSNAAWIQRITTPWSELAVTWPTAPSTTTQNQVALPASSTNTQDYPNIDVTALVQDMINNPNQSYGFMIKLQTESYYRSLLFASSDYPNPALHPKLDICYNAESTSIGEISDNSAFSIYPNPISSNSIIKINPGIKAKEIEIYSVLGKKIFSKKVTDNVVQLNKENLAVGIYIVRVICIDRQFEQKVFVE